jgi:hypothetical protein
MVDSQGQLCMEFIGCAPLFDSIKSIERVFESMCLVRRLIQYETQPIWTTSSGTSLSMAGCLDTVPDGSGRSRTVPCGGRD